MELAEVAVLGSVLALFLTSAVIAVFPRRWQRWSHIPCVLALFGSSIASLAAIWVGIEREMRIPWRWLDLPGPVTEVVLQFDGFTRWMLGIVNLIAMLVALYSMTYMAGDEGYRRYFSIFTLFVAMMSMLVLVGNLLLLYLFWEGVGLCSYLLIGHYRTQRASTAARKAFLVNRVADVALLIAIILLAWNWGTLNIRDLIEQVTVKREEASATLQIVAVLLVIGAMGKSAQLPFHIWLPDAMEGPTPVSALIHAATMVAAGVYLLIRMLPVLVVSPVALMLGSWVGTVTAVVAGLFAVAEWDLKRVLAYSTISQLGYMFAAVGIAMSGESNFAGYVMIFHLITHALFKALLFLCSGNIMHATGGVIDMSRLGGLKNQLGVTHWLFVIGGLSLAGIIPFAGYWSKDEILIGLAKSGGNSGGWVIVMLLGVVGPLLTGLYIGRAYWLTFQGDGAEVPREKDNESLWEVVPPLVLATGAVLAGLVLGPGRVLAGGLGIGLPEEEGVSFVPAVALAFAALGIVSGMMMGRRARGGTPSRWHAWYGVRKAIENGFYFDYVLFHGLGHVLGAMGKAVKLIDEVVIDGGLSAIAGVSYRVGNFIRQIQIGEIGFYAVSIGLGILVIWATLLLTFGMQ